MAYSDARRQTLEADAQSLFEAALERVQPDRLLSGVDASAWLPRPIDRYDRLQVVGMGKAALGMGSVVERRWGDRISGGAVVVPEGYPSTRPARYRSPQSIDVLIGGHPVPTEPSQRAARRLMQIADDVERGDGLIVLISGGGSALTADPASGLTLEAVRTTFQKLLASGADIHAVNTVRKHLTRVGGGQLARAAHPAEVGALVISDVVGDDLATIASGPTVPDPTTFADAVDVLREHKLWDDVPEPVRTHLQRGRAGEAPETLKPGDPVFDRVRTQLVGRNRDALEAARNAADELGYAARIVRGSITGEAREVGRRQAEALLQEKASTPVCLIWGGETTVTVRGDGMGGRNQEVALGAAQMLAKAGRPAVLLSGGTDGIDGPTDAAGAWVTSETQRTAQKRGFNLQAHLDHNDAYPLLDALDQLIRTGPTHTNVMDVQVGLIGPAE